jgi:hypothetical protein
MENVVPWQNRRAKHGPALPSFDQSGSGSNREIAHFGQKDKGAA